MNKMILMVVVVLALGGALAYDRYSESKSESVIEYRLQTCAILRSKYAAATFRLKFYSVEGDAPVTLSVSRRRSSEAEADRTAIAAQMRDVGCT